MSRSIEQAPAHLRARIEATRAELVGHGKYRRAKRGQALPLWEVSIDGARCGVLLDDWLGGLHHLPDRLQPSDIDWSREFVAISAWSFLPGLASFDGGGLTNLIVLAHEHAVRVELHPAGRNIELLLHPRDARCTVGDGTARRHATLIELRDAITRLIERTAR